MEANGDDKTIFTLSELTGAVRDTLEATFPETYWVRAETSDVRVNAASGHCYLEFIEKNPKTNQLVAKARGSIWAKVFRMLKPYFEMETGQTFTSGLKVLVKVTIEFHELYGFSLNVVDIDPTYTIGDMARKRQEIIRQLQADGVFTLNKELTFPDFPTRIAVITSPTAAGYEDFLNQLLHNQAGYPFYPKLFPALMQGEKTEESVIAALERIDACREYFDVVVIIRGGGATSDLSSFDSYLLAAHCAQFPLPIITGIGHERDDTIVDLVAHTRLKTPTAVAAFLIHCLDQQAATLNDLEERFTQEVRGWLKEESYTLQQIGSRFPMLVKNRLEKNLSALHILTAQLPGIIQQSVNREGSSLIQMKQRIRVATDSRFTHEIRFLELKEQFIRMASPDYILQRGYNLTLQNGKIVKTVKDIQENEPLTTRFMDGEVVADIRQIKKKK